jgi:hypothetical protein
MPRRARIRADFLKFWRLRRLKPEWPHRARGRHGLCLDPLDDRRPTVDAPQHDTTRRDPKTLEERDDTMSNRHSTMLWMKDLIEHMSTCHDQLQWAADGRTETFLTETLMGDLAECQRLCEQLRSGTSKGRAVLSHA